MLILYGQFLIRFAIRNPLYLANPKVLTEDQIELPRFSVVHYLNLKQNNHFPTRDLYYIRNIPKNKKVPITHIQDLDIKDDTNMLLNKYVTRDIRKWNLANLREFRVRELLEQPNNDTNLIPIYNYNILKDMYKYKTSLLSKHSKFFNLSKTYWNYVKKALSVDTTSTHFVSIDVPNEIPSYILINIMLQFKTIKISRIISNEDLYRFMDMYRWLLDNTRSKSSMADITDEDSTRIVIEFKYKGFSTFLPLSLIRSMCNESKLENTIKAKEIKVQRLFILMIRRMQDKVNTILEEGLIEEPKEDTTVNTEIDLDEEEDIPDVKIKNLINKDNLDNKIKLNDIKSVSEIDSIADNIELTNLNSLLDSALNKLDNEDDEVDHIYEETILKASKEEDIVEEEAEEKFEVNYSEDYIDKLLTTKNTTENFNKYIDEVKEFKTMTSTEIRSLKKVKENREKLVSPYNKDIGLDLYGINIPSDLELTDSIKSLVIENELVDNTLKKEVINNFDKIYLKKNIKKDIVNCVTSIEKSNIIIKNYAIEENKSSLGNYEIHKLNIKPLHGKESTIYFRLPIIDSEGEFRSGNIRYKMRKQKTDIPIRKISPTKVSLNSNYGKIFIFRTERKAYDSNAYVLNFIRESYLNEDGDIKKIIPGIKKLNNTKLPNVYNLLASNFDEIHTSKLSFVFKLGKETDYIKEDVLKDLQKKNLFFCGYLENKNIICIDSTNTFYNYTNNLENIGTIENLLNLDIEKIPKPFSCIKVLGDDIPLGVVFGYYLGMSDLLAITKTEYSLIEGNKQHKASKDEIVIKFNDHKLVIKTDTVEKELLFNGFLWYKDFTKIHNLKEFDYKEIYLNMFEFRNNSLIHIKELNLLEELFLDPITIEILKDINEPSDYFRLLLRANQLLEDFNHPDINDPLYSRIRGYDRIPGLMYKVLSESVREYKFKGRSNSKVELDPYKVWNYITQDNTVKIVEDLNPILDIKENEAVTLTGADGLNKDAVPMDLRRYHKNDIGLISEATVDSADVALNFYLSPFAKIKNTRGLVSTDSKEVKENNAKVFSTSALLTPMSELDDAKRVNFLNIQYSHTVPSASYRQPIVRTEFEYVMPYKTGSLYSSIAKEDGIIIDKTDKVITIKYKSGDQETIKIGNQYGRAEGSIYKHSIVTDFNKGDKVKANSYLAYNEYFFEKDWLDSSKLLFKINRLVSVALTLTDEVFEDSSVISKEISDDVTTTILKEKIYIIDFKKNIANILPEGTNVDPNSILFTVLEEDTDFNNLSDSTIEMLHNLSSLSPRAKVNGVIDKYEVKYNGDVSDMSPSLRKLVNRLDKQLYEETKGTEYESDSNIANIEYRSEGKNLNLDTLELKVFIKVNLSFSSGDKGVFAGQMKSVVCGIYSYNIQTESGYKIDSMFGLKSIINRTVISPILLGTTNRLVKHVSKQVADIYFNSK